ncbi:dihydrodipicolinate synthase family protein [Sphingobacterium sp. SGG-5]|uniref:dihydrodipicolinate synthase family protein n=1 Tax=Sphingobacterium sp. SGG-5 TaxID=2710881 RepID=UPI0013EDB936|nr:dihydrodipicolinate synthase family protein [Sphingobacterium sp. SGG-5]NGM62838.1 dihydrodipicolinate synthase family protein [Sphingobacterium sp. SGG-5]
MENKFKGVWPAMFTPVDIEGNVAVVELKKLVELLISQGMDGLYILGSTGQGVLFTEEQRKQVVEEVMAVNAGRVPIMVQVGAMTTAESVRLAQHAAKLGADAISSVGPIYFSGNQDTALEHYRQIAAASDLPFFPYQLGNNTMGNITGFIDELLKIPTLKGMKLTTGQLLEIGIVKNHVGDRLHLFSGADELMCHAALCGTSGAIGSFYNLWGPVCKTVRASFKEGNYALAEEFMLEFQKVIMYVLPNIWTFLRQAMQLKYGIDIGATKAPLGTMQKAWDDQEVQSIIDKIESMTEVSVA